MHVRSALVAILMLPVGVLIAFIAMRLLGMNSNLMSLGGIAIAIGAMVDAAIVMIENAHKHVERLPADHSNAERVEAMIAACRKWDQRCSFRCSSSPCPFCQCSLWNRGRGACSRHWPTPKPSQWLGLRFCP